MIDFCVKKFFENFVKTHVYHFFYQLVHIKGFHAKGFHFLGIFHFFLFLSAKNNFLNKKVPQICCKKSYTWKKRWNGCHIWIPLFFLIDLDILFVKFQFIDLKIWIIPY